MMSTMDEHKALCGEIEGVAKQLLEERDDDSGSILWDYSMKRRIMGWLSKKDIELSREIRRLVYLRVCEEVGNAEGDGDAIGALEMYQMDLIDTYCAPDSAKYDSAVSELLRIYCERRLLIDEPAEWSRN